MGAIYKEVYYCSKDQLQNFKQAFTGDEVVQHFLSKLYDDQLDVWFDLYRSVSANKEHVEHEVEKQIKRKQKKEHRRLLLKRSRLD